MKREGIKTNVFLTGASSGIGRAIASALLDEGYEVWGTARDLRHLSELRGLHPLEMDFLVPGSVEKAWARALEEAGSIDVVIQNAGWGHFGSIEETDSAAAQRQWVVLVDGPLTLLRLAAAHLRQRKRGWIIGISSLAGEMPMPFFAHYSAGKAALSALLAGLWMELHPFGVRVVDLRPGDIRTPFNEVAGKTIPDQSPYQPWIRRAWDENCRLLSLAPGPELVAKLILRMLRKGDAPAMKRCGSFFQAVIGPLGSVFLSRTGLLDSIRKYYQLDAKP
ncbi:MAG: SDR family NAD(P)-dependent oxidoreductase [Candidatus Methylacidiphilales bacterium]|nr:SDR family NAD(P)-dependent oxidoreductase [Candidatus Methylacidiphilales bacterium]